MPELFPDGERHAYGDGRERRPARREVAVYDYEDESGKLLYQKVRYEPKDFRQRRPDGIGGWAWSLDGVRRVLFRMPRLARADPRVPVLLVEGERDVLTAEEMGFLATTSTEGAGAGWDDDAYPALLCGRRVVVLPDNDRAGLAHAQRVAGALLTHGVASLRLVLLPGLAEKGDLTDWALAGGTREGLIEAVRAVPEWRAL